MSWKSVAVSENQTALEAYRCEGKNEFETLPERS
jgi:hypothetical protein